MSIAVIEERNLDLMLEELYGDGPPNLLDRIRNAGSKGAPKPRKKSPSAFRWVAAAAAAVLLIPALYLVLVEPLQPPIGTRVLDPGTGTTDDGTPGNEDKRTGIKGPLGVGTKSLTPRGIKKSKPVRLRFVQGDPPAVGEGDWEPGLRDLIEGAEVIVIATVTDTDGKEADLEVTKFLKGREFAPNLQKVRASGESDACLGSVHWTKDEECLVFLHRRDDGTWQVLHDGSGKKAFPVNGFLTAGLLRRIISDGTIPDIALAESIAAMNQPYQVWLLREVAATQDVYPAAPEVQAALLVHLRKALKTPRWHAQWTLAILSWIEPGEVKQLTADELAGLRTFGEGLSPDMKMTFLYSMIGIDPAMVRSETKKLPEEHRPTTQLAAYHSRANGVRPQFADLFAALVALHFNAGGDPANQRETMLMWLRADTLSRYSRYRIVRALEPTFGEVLETSTPSKEQLDRAVSALIEAIENK